MVKQYLRQQALAHRSLEQSGEPAVDKAGLRIWQEPPRRQFALRGDAGDKAFLSAVQKTCGLALPVKANTVSGDASAALLWLGPDEWLYSTLESAHDAGCVDDFAVAFKDQHCLLSEVSSSRCVLGLAGDHARQALMQGTSLDVHPKLFGPGQCAQTAFARTHVLIQPISDEPGYHLYIHRSFTDYLYRWLLDVAQRYAAS